MWNLCCQVCILRKISINQHLLIYTCHLYLHNCISKMCHLAPETHYKHLNTDQENWFSGTSKKLWESPPIITFLLHTWVSSYNLYVWHLKLLWDDIYSWELIYLLIFGGFLDIEVWFGPQMIKLGHNSYSEIWMQSKEKNPALLEITLWCQWVA